MTVIEALALVKYVTDFRGKKTHVLIPLEVWEALLTSWQELVEQAEEREDAELLQNWLAERTANQVATISLEALEQELIADGLISS